MESFYYSLADTQVLFLIFTFHLLIKKIKLANTRTKNRKNYDQQQTNRI